MFTGLIEDVGTLVEIKLGAEQASLTIETTFPLAEMNLGESIAINGVCLTVTSFADGRFSADISPETLKCTGLGDLTRGSKVNLERALRLSDRLGGHLVTGHVDGRVRLIERCKEGNAWFLRFQADVAITALLVNKGSVAIDGISLTVNEVAAETFSLTIIPHTLEQTSLKDRQVGDLVNVETDLLGKYVAKFLDGGAAGKSGGVTMDLLAKHGFL